MERIVKFQILYLWAWESLSIIIKNVKNAAEIMGDKEGIQLSTKRITLSTSGIVPEIIKWGNEVDSRLAISLHATNDELRNDIVPINKKFL